MTIYKDGVRPSDIQMHRVPGDIRSASTIPADNATHEDYDLRGALNTALVAGGKGSMGTSQAVMLRGVWQVNNNEAVAHEFRYADGGVADNDPAVLIYKTAAAAALYDVEATMITDASGNVKWEVDDRTKIDGIQFALTGWAYVKTAAE